MLMRSLAAVPPKLDGRLLSGRYSWCPLQRVVCLTTASTRSGQVGCYEQDASYVVPMIDQPNRIAFRRSGRCRRYKGTANLPKETSCHPLARSRLCPGTLQYTMTK